MDQVVLHYRDGDIRKGVTADFLPNVDRFHFTALNAPFGSTPHEVSVYRLKAVFFVKTFGGDPRHHKRNDSVPGASPPGRRVRVEFLDGEVMVGISRGLHTGCRGFYVTPVDPGTNNERCFVVTSAIKEVRVLPGGAASRPPDSFLARAWQATKHSLESLAPGAHGPH